MYRSRKHKMISGVCGGLAEQTGIPVTVVRLFTVLAAVIIPGVTVWMVGGAYLAAALFIPWKDERL